MPAELQSRAYDDHPLPIGHGQTISQPYIVALMTQLARPTAESRALEVGVGSGYQTAILAELCKEVYGIEILRPLADDARRAAGRLGYKNVTIRCGDGYQGWPEHAPFDVILVAAAPDHVPQPLLEQLAPGGRLVIPVGRDFQELMLIEKRPDGTLHRRSVAPVQFVPMTGEAEAAVERGAGKRGERRGTAGPYSAYGFATAIPTASRFDLAGRRAAIGNERLWGSTARCR